jgi:hypothetical protein
MAIFVNKMLIKIIYLEEGLIPTHSLYDSRRLNGGIDNLSKAEIRASKRKFRKKYRQLRKKRLKECQAMTTRRGWKKLHPTRTVKRTPGEAERVVRVKKLIDKLDDKYGEECVTPTREQLRFRRDAVLLALRTKFEK